MAVKQTRPMIPTYNAIRSAQPGQLRGTDVGEAIDALSDALEQQSKDINGLKVGVTNVTTSVTEMASSAKSSPNTNPPDTLGFDAIESGNNIQATMVVDTNATLTPADTGVVGSNVLYNGLGDPVAPITGTAPTHPGEILISQPDGSAAFADPLVQGLYPEGASVIDPPAFTAPTTIQPVLTGVSASDTLFALRTADTFKTFQSQGGTPGQQGIWTPASGKKFRVMRVWISVSGNAGTSSGGLLTISLTDGMAGNTVGAVFDVWIPPATPTLAGGVFAGAIFDSGWADMGNGYLSTGANQVLFLNTSLQLSSGFVRINVFGTEEA